MNILKPLILAVLLPTAFSATAQRKKLPVSTKDKSDQVILLDQDQSGLTRISKERMQEIVHKEPLDISSFSRTPSDLLYKIFKGGASTPTAKIGDIAMIHIKYFLGDSMLIDSKLYNEGQPVPQQIEAAKYSGDISEGLQMLAAGDSGIFMIRIDSLELRTGMQRPSFIKDATYARWDVKMESVQSSEEFEASKKAMEQAKIQEEDKELNAYFAKNKVKAVKTGSGLYYVLHKAGTGPEAKSGQTVTVNYTGRLLSGKKFDSNVDSSFKHVAPFSFPLGAGRVIKGWDEAVQLLRKGGDMTVYIPSRLAYGPNSPSSDIPANSILVFDIALTDIAAEAPKVQYTTPPPPPKSGKPIQQVQRKAQKQSQKK